MSYDISSRSSMYLVTILASFAWHTITMKKETHSSLACLVLLYLQPTQRRHRMHATQPSLPRVNDGFNLCLRTDSRIFRVSKHLLLVLHTLTGTQ